MSSYDEKLQQRVPDFDGKSDEERITSEFDISASVRAVQIHGWKQALGIIIVAVLIIGSWESLVRLFRVPEIVLPTPSQIVVSLVNIIPIIWHPHLTTTLIELALGYLVGASLGFFLAAVLTQVPFLEKIITPYILLLITTPTVALVPLLMLKMGVNIWPRVVAVVLAVGPMVMINSVTGFRRTDLAKIALARSYGASTLQIFLKIRFPLALPMIDVGLLVGGIFGLITAVASDMVGGSTGLGNRLAYYSSLGRMANFFAVVLIVAVIGISMWLAVTAIGKRWASWKE